MDEEDRIDFKKHLVSYVRLYAFLSQIISFTDPELEKLYQFARHLGRKLPVSKERLPVDIKDKINMDSYRLQQTSSGEIKLINEDGELDPIKDLGTGHPTGGELTPLSEIIHFMNEHYGADFTDADKVKHFTEDMALRLFDNDALVKAANPEINSEDNFRLAFNEFFDDTLEDMIESNHEIYLKIVDDEELKDLFKKSMFNRVYGQLTTAEAHA